MSDTEEEKVVEDCSNPDVVTKYNSAGGIANDVMQALVELCVDGAIVHELCVKGDAMIVERTGKLYKKGKMQKGIAFPTCFSINEIVGHHSPCAANIKNPDPEDPALTAALKNGDLVKIDLGVHLDGYATVCAHSLIVGGTEESGRAASLLAAAETAAELAHRMLKPGNKNTDMTEMFAKVAKDFGVNVVQGVLSHVMNRHVVDGEKVIISKNDVERKVAEVEFDTNEVYAIDIVMSSGAGKPKATELPVNVYKRNIKETYRLKLKASRAVFKEVQDNAPSFPFTVRSLPTTLTGCRLGLKEMLQHNLVQAYPVLTEPKGELTVHVKFTAVVSAGGAVAKRFTKVAYAPHGIDVNEKLKDADLKTLLQTSVTKKKKKKKNKKKAAAE